VIRILHSEHAIETATVWPRKRVGCELTFPLETNLRRLSLPTTCGNRALVSAPVSNEKKLAFGAQIEGDEGVRVHGLRKSDHLQVGSYTLLEVLEGSHFFTSLGSG
jgi:hypothetical protein